MTLLELMPPPPKMRRLRALMKPECNQRRSEKAKIRIKTEKGKAHMARITELAKKPEARAKLSKTRILQAEARRRREATLACVAPTYRRCRYCKQFADPTTMVRSHRVSTPKNSVRFAHRDCNAQWFREYRRKRRQA
jgi:hypothetical protein